MKHTPRLDSLATVRSVETLDPSSLIDFGGHRGTALRNVPEDYLVWFYMQEKVPNNMKVYIETYVPELEQKILEKKLDKKEQWKAQVLRKLASQGGNGHLLMKDGSLIRPDEHT